MNFTDNHSIWTNSFLDMWQVLGSKYATINDEQKPVVISGNRKSTDFDPLTIRAITPLSCGNMVGYQNKSWLIISEVSTERSGIYRGLIRLCNHNISVQTGVERVLLGYDSMGRPVYKDTPIFTDFPCIVDGAGFHVDSNQAINLARDEIRIMMKHDSNSGTLTVNQVLSVLLRNYAIQVIDRSRVGVLTLIAKVKL